MLRPRENAVSFKAGMLSFAVHGGLLLLLLISINWKTTQPVNIAEVELWDSIPSTNVPLPEPEAVAPPVDKEPLPPEPKPVVEDKPEPEVDIALEKKLKALEQKKLAEQIKKDEELAQKKKLATLQEDARKDDLRVRDQALKDKKTSSQNDALKKLQQEALADDKAAGDQQASAAKSAANAGVVSEYKNKIQTKIRANVNKTLCNDGNPQLIFDIALLPTGELSGSPKLVKSSGSAACDDAVERAIIASEPLPLPSDISLFSQFRNLKLKFSPKDG